MRRCAASSKRCRVRHGAPHRIRAGALGASRSDYVACVRGSARRRGRPRWRWCDASPAHPQSRGHPNNRPLVRTDSRTSHVRPWALPGSSRSGGCGTAPGLGGIGGCGAAWFMSMVPLNLDAADPVIWKPHLEHACSLLGFWVPQLGQNTGRPRRGGRQGQIAPPGCRKSDRSIRNPRRNPQGDCGLAAHPRP